MKKDTIFITGSAGFIGSNLIRHILYNYKNYKIVSVDCLDSNMALYSRYMNRSHDFYIADIKDTRTMQILLNECKPDYIINLGYKKGQDSYKNNVIALDSFLEQVITNCNPKNFIQLSPCRVYDLIDHYADEYESALCPHNKKTSSNICAEIVLGSYWKTNSLQYNIIRYSPLFGPRQCSNGNIIFDMYKEFKKHKKVSLNNKGELKRNLLHVEDLCLAIMPLLQKGSCCGVYNVSTNTDFTDLEIAEFIRSYIGEDYSIEFSDCILENEFINLDVSRIKDLEWKPKKFRERLKQTIGWYENNKWIL